MKYIIDGKVYKPIRVGEKLNYMLSVCPECESVNGEYHNSFCNLEICPRCKRTRGDCTCLLWMEIGYYTPKNKIFELCKLQKVYLKDYKKNMKKEKKSWKRQ